MSLGCPQCGTLDGSKHAKDCTWLIDHPTVGQIVTIEYAGFMYSVCDKNGEVTVTPISGQHPAASKDKHVRAAREQYSEDLKSGVYGAFCGSKA